MALAFDFQPRDGPTIPDGLAHEAADLAVRSADARRSREALERLIASEINHPVHAKVQAALQSRRFVPYGILTLVFAGVLYWEWRVSNEIYQVVFAVSPLIPFVTLAGFSFLASVLLSEGISTFSIFSIAHVVPEGHQDSTRVISSLYGRRSGWTQGKTQQFCLIGGLVVAALVECAVFYMSEKRTELLQAAGELGDAAVGLQLQLPVFLFGADIVLGVAACFFVVCLADWSRMRVLERRLRRARDQELLLQRAALERYMGYVTRFTEYNSHRDGRPQALLITPTTELRRLLMEQYGRDPTESAVAAPSSGEGHTNSHEASQEESAPPPAPSGSPNGPESQRVEDLLNLVDEQIAAGNRSI